MGAEERAVEAGQAGSWDPRVSKEKSDSDACKGSLLDDHDDEHQANSGDLADASSLSFHHSSLLK